MFHEILNLCGFQSFQAILNYYFNLVDTSMYYNNNNSLSHEKKNSVPQWDLGPTTLKSYMHICLRTFKNKKVHSSSQNFDEQLTTCFKTTRRQQSVIEYKRCLYIDWIESIIVLPSSYYRMRLRWLHSQKIIRKNNFFFQE